MHLHGLDFRSYHKELGLQRKPDLQGNMHDNMNFSAIATMQLKV